MLSTGAVNAFLKTLEEPPANVIFILATTDPQKLPITILSRCQRFDFRRINNSEITARLRKIVENKGVFAEDKSLDLIARVSDGAMRDSLSILDQAIAMGDGNVDYDEVVSMLGLVTNEYLFELTDATIARDIEKAMTIIEKIVYAGKDVYLFIKDLIAHYRNLLMIKVTNNPEEVLDMSLENIALIKNQGDRIRVEEIMRSIRILQEAENSAKMSKQARLYLELSIIKICKIEYDTSNEVILGRLNKLESALKSGKIQVAKGSQAQSEASSSNINELKKTVTKNSSSTEDAVRRIEADPDLSSDITIQIVKSSWKDILEEFKNRRAMILYASITTGKPVACNNGIVNVQYTEQYSFNKNRLEKPENNKLVNEVFSEVLRNNVRVKFTVAEDSKSDQAPEEVLSDVIGTEFLEIIDE